ncbi:aldolase [Gordonia sp. TBRC 11910]|uniref:Aldolase n=1 Tax=Gordonia asplenii TaxID=2725283 RepID=A0A848KTS0_9ACTN|nr:aldolase/citrate lyase family protein [Gordonia asplenii]NMO00275.1 aldolase [Gordonia asplenii]
MTHLTLSPADYAVVDDRLAGWDARLAAQYPGDDGRRQPVQTTYVAADRFTPTLAADWGARAQATADAAGGLAAVARDVGLGGGTDGDARVEALAELVAHKLATEPIEDLRLDFEDGYGMRGDVVEDADVAAAVDQVVQAYAQGSATPFLGIRFKCFEAPTRARGLRTLDLYLSGLLAAGDLPDGLVLTLPKVTSVDQVEAMVYVTQRLEAAHGLDAGRLRFEVQIETPQVILGADGTAPVAQLLHAAAGRVSSLHYGTYDYSASLGIAAQYQSMEHPVADHAKNVMQLAVAGTGVHLSDGSTNILPAGDPDNIAAAWRLHARLVRRHLERGIYQGWDMHPAQLVTRYLATYAFYRDGFDAAATRLRNYVHKVDSAIMDEPATARALAAFIRRGVVCGAVTRGEVEEHAGVDLPTLHAVALNQPVPN